MNGASRRISKRTATLVLILMCFVWWANGFAMGTNQPSAKISHEMPAPGVCPTDAELLEILKTNYWFHYGDQVTGVKTGYGAHVCQEGWATIQLTAILGPKEISHIVVLHYGSEDGTWYVISTKWESTTTHGPDTFEV